jgi:neutral ceramidase
MSQDGDRSPSDRSPSRRVAGSVGRAVAFRGPMAIVLAIAWALNGEACKAHADDAVEIGVAVVDITPPVGYRMSGYFYERLSTGVHNPLFARAIAFRQGNQTFVWTFCDLLGVPVSVTAPVRTSATVQTGIPRENIFVAATHCHTGPLYFGPLRDFFHAQAMEHEGLDEHEAIDYPAELTQKLLTVISGAVAAVAPTEVLISVAEQPGLAFNRRYFMKNGSVTTNPGKLNPNIERPAGPTDADLTLLQFRREGRPFAGLTLFALHLDTTGGTEFAADFPYYLQRDLRAAFGPDYDSIFAIGACGDVNHFDVSHDRPQKGHAESERIGSTIAATALQALESAKPLSSPALAAMATTVAVPLQKYTPAEVVAARESLSKVGTREMPMLDQVSAVKVVGIDDYGVEDLPMDVQAFRLSDDVAAVAIPGELFVELGLAIKQRSPFATTLVFELSNDYPGYIPTRRGFAEGSYEPTNSKLAPGGGELLVSVAVDLLQQLKGEERPVSAAK